MKTYRIFLASSAELVADRIAFEIFLSRYNQQLAQQQKHVTFELYVWERESEAIFDTRKQDQYNQNLLDCDLFVLLCWTKVGMYTNEEFDTALSRFRAAGKPILFTYQKTTTPPHTPTDADRQSLGAFATKLLQEVGHFTGQYDLPGELTTGFQAELEKLFARGALVPGVRAECLHDAGKAAVPDTFVGRQDELTTIRQRLREGGRLMLINAEGGMGKTTLAAKYWDEHQYHYQHTAWLFCEKGIVEEMKNLAEGLGIDLRQYPDEKQQIEAIRTALNNKARTGDCLLVIDNANDPNQIRAFEQHFGGVHWHVLMTSRCSGVLGNEFPIRHLPPPVAKKLFMDLYPHESGSEFEALLDTFLIAVGYNTLAIEIFAKNLVKAYHYDRETMANFLMRLSERGLLLGNKSFKVKTGYLQAVHKSQPGDDATTDQIIEALYDLTQLADAERDWLINLALLPAVSHDTYFLGQLFGLAAGDLAENKLEPLARKGWLSTDTATFRLSPVVQRLVLAKHEDILWETGKPLVDRLNHLLKTDGAFTKNLTLTQARPFAEVGLPVANALPVNTWERGLLYGNLSDYFRAVGLLTQAMQSARQYQLLSEARADQENLAISYSKLGSIYQALGDLKQARTYFEKYLQLTEQLAQANPESESLKNGLAISYERLGGIYQALGDLKQARTYFEKRSQLGEQLAQANPESESLKNGLAISYGKLGDLYQALGDLKQAKTYFEKQTDLFEQLAQANPESESLKNGLAVSYSKLGDLYQALGDLKQAKTYLQKDLQLTEELAQANPESESLKNGLAISYSKLGGIYQALGDLKQAKTYLQKDLQLTEELAQANPESVGLFNGLAISYYKLAMVQGQLGQLQEAFDYLKKAEQIWQTLAEAVPDVPEYSRNLATVQQILTQLTSEES